jgi:hypothetical protein
MVSRADDPAGQLPPPQAATSGLVEFDPAREVFEEPYADE